MSATKILVNVRCTVQEKDPSEKEINLPSKKLLDRALGYWRKRESSSSTHKDAWGALARALEPNSIGNAPQKNHRGLMDLVYAARAMAEERGIVPGENPHIPSQATFALENSVRFYYIVPSASTYKVCSL